VVNDLIGRILGDYRLESKLASGGMSHVYIGVDVSLGRRAAVKILTPDFRERDEYLVGRFQREARAIGQLEHDNIVPLYQYGEQDGLLFLAMRYVDGPDLADVLKNYRHNGELMPVQRALHILEQVAIALDYAHTRGIIHRDVKPSNVLLGERDKAILTDFGLALWEDVDRSMGTAFGTPRYIAPEQASDSQTACPQSDIYSLGVVAYEILTGQRVFNGQNAMEIALAHINEPPLSPRIHVPSIPYAAEAALLQALSKAPEDRQPTAVTFIHALKQAYDIAHDEYGMTLPMRMEPLSNIDQTAATPYLPGELEASRQSAVTPVVADEVDALLASWDEPIAAPVPPEQPETDAASEPASGVTPLLQAETTPELSTTAGGRSRVMLLALPVLAIIVVAGLLMTQSGAPADSGAGGTPGAGMSVLLPTVAPDEARLVLRYNDNLLALVNTSPAALNLSRLTLQSDDARFALDVELGGGLLAPGACVPLVVGQAPLLPADWDCQPVRTTFLAQDAPRFWLAEQAEDQRFRVLADGQELATCNTVGRPVERTETLRCELIWPDFDSQRLVGDVMSSEIE